MSKELLKELRQSKHLSLAKLATLVGTQAPQIDKLERGIVKISPKWARLIAPHLGTTPEALLDLHPQNPAVESTENAQHLEEPSRLDKRLMQDVIVSTEEFLAENRISLSFDKKAALMTLVYDEIKAQSRDKAKEATRAYIEKIKGLIT